MIRKSLLFFLLIAFFSGFIFAEDPPGSNSSAQSKKTETDEPEYEPYSPEEFSPFLHGLRRSEVLFFGSIPITYLYCNLGYLAYSQSTGNHLYSEEKNFMLLYTSLSLSAAVVLLDFILGKIYD